MHHQWSDPVWIAQAQQWIRHSLAEIGETLTGPIQQLHVRIWSTVMRCPASTGIFYFKACQPPVEARMTAFLRTIQPENLPDLAAVDLEKGWMLMRDAGPMLRSSIHEPADLHLLEPALRLFATLQLKTAAYPADTFLSLGARDRRLGFLPNQFEELLSDTTVLRIGKEDGLTIDENRRLIAILSVYKEMCQQLQTYRVPQALHHDDFHDGNIFVSGPPEKINSVFSDWEESAFTHPFFSMMLCLRSVAGRAGFPDEATEAPDRMPAALNNLRDVYLRHWERFEEPNVLIEIFNLAWRVGMVSRALTWRGFVNSLAEEERVNFNYFVPAWLQEFLLAMRK